MIRILIITFFLLTLPHHVVAQTSSQSGSGASGTAGTSAAQSAITAGTNLATGAMMFSMCTPTSMWYCALGALSIAQAGLDLTTGKSSRDAAKSLITSGNADWRDVDLGGGMTGGQLDSKFASAENAFETLKKDALKKGIDIDKGTVKTPKGTKSLASLGSGAALADAGLLSADQIDEADALIKKNNDKLQQIALQNTTGGGGGGSRATTVKYDIPSPDYSGLFGEKEKPNAPKTAGLVKTIDGQPYGASINNLFDMIRNRYEMKTREKFFVEQ